MLFSQLVQGCDVGLVKLSDVRDGGPILRHPLADDFAELGKGFAGDGPPFSEIGLFGARGFGFWRGSRFGQSLETLNVSADIGHDDSAAALTAANPAEVDAKF